MRNWRNTVAAILVVFLGFLTPKRVSADYDIQVLGLATAQEVRGGTVIGNVATGITGTAAMQKGSAVTQFSLFGGSFSIATGIK